MLKNLNSFRYSHSSHKQTPEENSKDVELAVYLQEHVLILGLSGNDFKQGIEKVSLSGAICYLQECLQAELQFYLGLSCLGILSRTTPSKSQFIANLFLSYQMAHIWACPPSEGDDYIFHCHPVEQKIPKHKRLVEWYKKMLDKAIMDRVVIEYKVSSYIFRFFPFSSLAPHKHYHVHSLWII